MRDWHEDVDARHKAGHDELYQKCLISFAALSVRAQEDRMREPGVGAEPVRRAQLKFQVAEK